MASKEGKVAPVRTVPRNIADVQRLKLEKLMENPDKMVLIPERHKDKTLPPPPEFNRNVMGSSAGAGSGEFHVYRHIRRREYARQKLITEKARRENLDDAYHNKLEENKRLADEKTAKKRAKRLRKKEKMKTNKKSKPNAATEESKPKDESEDTDDSSENDES
uniref:PRKR-interacting protein 1 n=1 Tax=Strigamia maritima TaxID=126957 RepID=T1J2K1_STRMM